jgi:sulfur carrier protein ThiS
MDVEDGLSIGRLLDDRGVPPESAHLVLKNGFYVAPDQRAQERLSDGDVVAVWPPVAGG